MSLLNSVGSLVAKALPKVMLVAVGGPAALVGLNILKQLTSSMFAKDGQGGVFNDRVQVSLPNPLSRLNNLLGKTGEKFNSASDFLANIGNFLQGNRTLENGSQVNVPKLSERGTSVAKAAALVGGVAAGGLAAGAIAKAISSSGSNRSIVGGLPKAAFNTGLTSDQKNMLKNVKDPTQRAQMESQFQMQNYQNLMQFISNIMRIMGDVSKSLVSNIR